MTLTFKSKTNKINHDIACAKTVSFDVFDTLIKRDVPAPSDVFSLMEEQLLRDGTLDIKEFTNKRIEAEKNAKMKSPDREITLKDIYAGISMNEIEKDRLMQLECQTEIAVSTPNIPMKLIYEECVRQGKIILFISDMYLPTDVIMDILRKNGYMTGKLYVSSESGFTKRSGKMFTHILKQEKITIENWIHIGDAISSDYLIPKKLGIRSFLIDHTPVYNTIVNRKLARTDKEYQTMTQFINNRISRYSNFYEQLGYAVLGPLLYGFTKWLDDQDLADETLVFLAREGALLKEAFEIVSEKPSVYMYISRRAALCAAISQIDDFELVSQGNMRTMKKGRTAKELAMNYGLSQKDIKALFASAGLDEEHIIFSHDTESIVLKIIWQTAQENSEKQHALLQRYLEQLDVSDKCTVVDVGWHGTVQALLSFSNLRSGGKNIRWIGCYIGDCETYGNKAYSNIVKKGFLFAGHRNSEEEHLWQLFRSTMSLLELLFLSTEGTTICYDEIEGGTVYPVKDQPDNSLSAVANIDLIQKSGLHFVADMYNSSLEKVLVVDSHMSSANYIAFVKGISLSEIRKLQDFKEIDGDANGGVLFVSSHGFLYYMIHPREFKADFTRATSKLLFLKGVFKLPLPYVSILTFLRKHFRTY